MPLKVFLSPVSRLILFLAIAVAMRGMAQESPNREHGFAPDRIYQFGDIDSVDLFSGGLAIRVPLGQTYRVTDGLSYGLTLVYNGNVWDFDQRCTTTYPSGPDPVEDCHSVGFPSRFSNAGLGFLVTLGELLAPSSEWNQTTQWIYVSPDGGRHTLYPPTTGATVFYSKDTTFLRMREAGPDAREIDFPDGTIHRFEASGTNWRLREIRDRYSAVSGGAASTNYIRVNYTIWEGGNAIEIVDSFGRTQRIKYVPGFADPGLPPEPPTGSTFGPGFRYPPMPRDNVRFVDLAGPDGTTETYEFIYDTVTDGLRPDDDNDVFTPADAQFRVLRSLKLPDGSSYSFEDTAEARSYDRQGNLMTFRLPTGGRISYTYEPREFPNFKTKPGRDSLETWTHSIAVRTRTLLDTTPGAQPAEWRYEAATLGAYQCVLAGKPCCVLCPPLEMNVVVTDPLGNRSENFFSLTVTEFYVRWVNTVPTTSPYTDGWRNAEYALPLTHRFALPDDATLFLSSRLYNAAGTIVRSTWVRYESDPVSVETAGQNTDRNRRLLASRTVYDDDTSCGGACYVEVENDPLTYDGYGHYRRQTTRSNFGPMRGSFTNYSGASIAPEQPWLTGLYDEQSITDGTHTAYQRFCFDPATGRLTRTRMMSGSGPAATDLVTALEYDDNGNLERESFHGGDDGEVPDDLCGAELGTAVPQYAIRHQAPLGIRTKTDYVTPGSNTSVLSLLNLDLDSNGFLETSQDAAGLATGIEHFVMGRPHEIRPPGAAWTEYIYKKVGDDGVPFARVIVRQHPVNSTDVLSENQVEFDGFGRVFRETTKMPGGGESVRLTTYNPNGWKETVSERDTSPSAHLTVFSNFDAFGRARLITAPDGKQTKLVFGPVELVTPAGGVETRVEHTGAKTIERTVGIAMSAGADTPVTTTETYDAHGRLVTVAEPSGTASDPSNPRTANVETQYSYDLFNHLTRVETTDTTVSPHPHQLRTFTYDFRGLMTEELHPEKGTTHYHKYDARGRLLRKQEGTSAKYDLTYTYDKAERLTQIRSTYGGEAIKEFFFDSVNDGVHELSGRGRLLKAVRHNRSASLGDVQVTDYYEYDNAGRVSVRDTLLSTGPAFKQNFSYTDLGQPSELRYPTCTGCGSANRPDRRIPLSYSFGLLTGVQGFTPDNGITYWPNGMLHQVTHTGSTPSHNTIDTQDRDSSGMARPASITFSGYCTGPPVNANQPENKTIVSGATATLSVSQEGSGPRTYTWYQVMNGVATAIPNSNAATFTTAPLSATSYFYVMVSDGTCATRSRTATVTIRTCDSVDITTQPASKVVTSGSPVTFTVVATDPSAHYEWYEGSSGTITNHVGGDSSHYDVASATASTRYWVRVFSGDRLCSIDSATATLDICTPPVITVQPRSQSHAIPASGGATLSTSVVATGYNLRYEWYQVAATPVLVATGPTLNVTLTSADPGPKEYYVRVSSDTGGCGNPATSQVVTMRLNHCFTFFSSSGDHLAYPGAGVWTLSVRAEGEGAPFTYKWFHGVNGQSIEMGPATEDIVVGLAGDYDAFWCVVTCSDDSGCKGQSMTTPKSYASRWGVCPLPPVSVSPVTATIAQGTTATFTATVDWPRVTYQWYHGQSGDTRNPLGGEIHKTLTVASVVSTAYWVRVTNECGTQSEDSRTVTVTAGSCIPITIDASPQSVNIAAGGGATLRAAASSSSSFSYSWFAEGSTTSLGSGASLTVHPAVTTTYYAQASNSCFTAETLRATVHVTSCGTINITQQPGSHPIPAGSTTGTDLSITATSTGGAILYQWYRGTSGDTSHPIDLATSSIVHVTPAETTSYWVRLTTASCTVDSATAVVTWCVPPHFQTAVSGASLRLGQWALLESTAVGTDLQYEWSIEGAPETVISRERAFWIQPSNTTRYILKVIGCLETIYSPPIVITVCTTPAVVTLVTQPPLRAVFPGKTAQLHVSAWEANDVPLTYQWQDAATGTTVGTNSPDFTTPPITEEKRYLVHLQAGVCGTDSEEVKISLCTLPEVVTAGATLHVTPQQTVTLHLPFPATSDNSYAWYRGPVGNTSDPVGGNSYDYSFFAAASGEYWATVTNPGDGCISRSSAFIVKVCVPSIAQQPASIMLSPPATSVALSVTASPATAWQWYIGEKGDITTPVPGGTTSTINVSPATDTRYWVRVIGSCGLDERGAPIGAVDSESALVTVCQPPVITQTTPGPWIVRGSSFGIGVVASGTSLTYQWYTGTSGTTTSPINGATGANYIAAPQNTTSYWVRVTGACGTLNSSTITVSVCMTPSIPAHPQSVSIFSGSTTTLSVTAFEGTTAPINYQWYRGATGDTSVPVGTNAATFTTPALTANTDYWVRASCGTCAPADSQTATVSMCLYAQTIAAPPNVQAAIGQVTRLTGTSAIAGNSYRWYRGASGDQSTPLTDWQAVNYLDVNPTTTTQYWYRLQNGACVSNSGTVTVNVCVPTITTQPASVMINPGASTTLSVVANTPGLTYQWFTGTSGTTTSPINGAIGASVSVSPSAATNYWVRVTGSCGVATNSVTAAVTICQPPSITQTTPGPWIVRGSSFGIGVVASGTSLTYQWYTGTSGNTASPINGANGASYTAAPQNTTSYWVRVTGTCGTLNSSTITVSVCMTPSIPAHPQSVSIFSGSTTTLSVTAFEGTTAPINYQWYRGATGDTSVPVGTNAATFTTPALTASTNYWVRVSCGTCAPADSQTATVSICANPQIVGSSGDVQTAVGQLTRLATVTGDSYSWYRGAAPDTTNPLSVGSPYPYLDVAPSVTTQYWAQVMSGTCVSRTNTITVSVCVPQITQQPQSVTIAAGATTTLTAAANTAGVAYQWYTGTSGNTTSPISGATNPTRAVSPASTTSYWVRATSSCGRTVDSATATVTICAPTAITRQPNDMFSYAGYNVTPDVLASGSNLTYQWYAGEAGVTTAPISGATSNMLTHYLVTTTRVWVRVTGQCGSVDSRAIWLSVIPTIQGQPQSQVISSGSNVTITVNANANGSVLHYQWRNIANNAVVPGSGDTSYLILTNVTAPISVYCAVTSGTATVNSAAAEITLCSGPEVTMSWGYSGSCRVIYANIGGDYSQIDWFRGQSGDVSSPLGAGSYSLYVCPTAPTAYWCRVYGTDPGTGMACNTNSPSVTVSP